MVRAAKRRAAPFEKVAVKSIPKSENFDAKAVRWEIATLQRLSHPTVMEVLDVFEDRKHVHIVSPYYQGDTRRTLRPCTHT